jgi:hypothetical protein
MVTLCGTPYLVQGKLQAQVLSGVCWRINKTSKTKEWGGKRLTCNPFQQTFADGLLSAQPCPRLLYLI